MRSWLDRGRFRAGVCAVVMLAAVVAHPGAGRAAGGQCKAIDTVAGGWSAAPLPTTPSLPAVGPTPIVAASVVGQESSVVLATDGISVFRTADGGCSWETVFTLGAADYYSLGGLASGYSITNIASSHASAPVGKQDVYLALTPNPVTVFSLVTLFGAAPPELIAASHDGGKTFAVVTPQPSLANPYPVECDIAPNVFVVPPTDGRSIYLMCSGGLAQAAAEQIVSGGKAVVFRSSDGGVTWNLIGVPVPFSATDGTWFVPSTNKNELWAGGYESVSTATAVQDRLTVWRSRDAGATWSRSVVEPTLYPPATAISGVGLAVDTAPGRGFGTVAIYSSIGTFSSADSGKTWKRMRAVTFANGTRPPVSAFFLGHALYVLFASQINCKGDPVFVRYPKPTSKPVTVPFPSKWGRYGGWSNDTTFSVTGRGLVGTGIGHFCGGNGAVDKTNLLSLRAH